VELLKDIPTPFLFLLIFAMGGVITLLFGYLLWSIKGILTQIHSSLSKLFERYESVESRLSKIEGKCERNHLN
jgi:uncharacterized protein with PQ loop repeat